MEIMEEGDRQVKSVYESVIASGGTLNVGDLFGDLLVEIVSHKVTRILVLLNGYVILNLPREYFEAHRTSTVRLSSFFTKSAATSCGGLYAQFFKGNVFELRAEGDPAVGAAAMHLEHFFLDKELRTIIGAKFDKTLPEFIMLAPVTYLFPGRGAAFKKKGELVTSMYFARRLIAGIIHSIHIRRTPDLDGVRLVRVLFNGMACVSISPRAIGLTQSDQDAPMWTIPLGFRNNHGDNTHGVNGSRVDQFDVEFVWDPAAEANEKHITIVLSQYTPWAPSSGATSIFGDVYCAMPEVKPGSLIPTIVHAGSDPTVHIDFVIVINEVKDIYKRTNDWGRLRQLCEDVAWLRSYPCLNHTEGFWSGDFGACGLPLPIPGNAVVDAAFIEKLETIQAGAETTTFLGVDFCRICRSKTKDVVYREILGDGEMWRWRESLIHYYTAHNIKPSDEFYQAVMSFM